jgi:putative ABC transport system permease protein
MREIVGVVGDVHVAATIQQQFTSGLLGTFAALATTLAVIGLYGVTALFVNQRRHEFGIRMALGAGASDVLLLVMRQGAKVIVGGAVAGVLGAFAASRIIGPMLFGVSAINPTTYFTGTPIICVVGAMACYVPARRAVRVDPLRALRYG